MQEALRANAASSWCAPTGRAATPTITQALAALGRQGVPVYVLYRPGKEPLLLPEVLQQQTVLDALATL